MSADKIIYPTDDSVRDAIAVAICEHCEQRITQSIAADGTRGPWIDNDNVADGDECASNTESCGECRGSGEVEIDCESCEGTGETGDGEDYDTCESCGGDGVDYDECTSCEGGELTGEHEPRPGTETADDGR